MNGLNNIIRNIVDRIRRLETIQEGNGFVPYLFPCHQGDSALQQTYHGKYSVLALNLTYTHGYISLTMPRKIANLEEAVLIYIPIGTGTWDYTIESSGGYCGEDESEHTDSITDDSVAVTDDEKECLDISAVLTPYNAGDTVGIRITCDALDTATQIDIIGIRLR